MKKTPVLSDIEGVVVNRFNPPDLSYPYCNTSNPSILYDRGLFYINLRATNYFLEGSPTKCTPYNADNKDQTFHTQNWIGVTKKPMDGDIDWLPVVELPRKYHSDKIGLEDARLVKWNKQFYLSGTRRDFNDGCMGRIVLTAIDKDPNGKCWKEKSFNILQGTCNDINFCEKNHQPVLDKPLCWCASTEPTFVYKANLDTNNISAVKGKTMLAGCQMMGCLRGSSQLVPYRNFYFALVHHSEIDNKGQHHYYHHLAIYDSTFCLIKVSDPFKIEGAIIEFSCGMCIVPGQNEWEDVAYITYSVMDSLPSIMVIPVPMLLNAV